MQNTVKRSLFAAAILGILFPSTSLLYVRREGLAVFIMALLLGSVLLLDYTDLTFFATSFWVFILTQITIWFISFILGIWYAHQGISINTLKQDRGLYWIIYILLLLTFVSMLSNIPVSFFTLKKDFNAFYAADIIVVQKTQNSNDFNANDTLIFLDDSYTETIGSVLASPNDVLTSQDGKILRNDILSSIEMDLPARSWIVPDNMLLIQYPSENIALLPTERIKGKGIYVLFSKKFAQNGKALTDIIIPQ